MIPTNANLPACASAAFLLMLALGFFVAEVKMLSHGLLAAVGVIFLVAGVLVWPGPGRAIRYAVNAGAALGAVAAVTVIYRAARKVRDAPVTAGAECLAGARGVAKTELRPQGIVLVEGEDWNAEADPPPVAAGEKIEVFAIHGLTLQVRKLEMRAVIRKETI